MAKIIYFGTKGCPGHCPIGVDAQLTEEEYKTYDQVDNERWISDVISNPGYRVKRDVLNGNVVLTRYSFPWSIDDSRNYSHTNLIWLGEHTEEEMIDKIKSIPWLSKQFKMDTLYEEEE